MGIVDDLDGFLDGLDDIKVVDERPSNDVLPEILQEPVSEESAVEEAEAGDVNPVYSSYGSDEDIVEETTIIRRRRRVSPRDTQRREASRNQTREKVNNSGKRENALVGLFKGVTGFTLNIIVVICIIVFLYFGLQLLAYMLKSGFQSIEFSMFY